MLGHVAVKWFLAAITMAVCSLLLMLVPHWPIRLGIAALAVCYVIWIWLTQEKDFGRTNQVRPLTRYDVPDYIGFRERLAQACDDAGLRREPIWAVEEDSSANAMAIGGTRGVVVFTTGLLKAFPPEEVLAVAGHELQHLASRDTLPVIIASAWFHLVRTVSHFFESAGHRSPGIMATMALLIASAIDVSLSVVSWLARIVLAKRSRHAEHLADLAGARLTSAGAMISALHQLSTLAPKPRKYPTWSAAWLASHLYASHPPTEDRVAVLQAAVERGDLSA